MLPSGARVTTELFKEVFSKGKVYTTPLFSVRIYENPTLSGPLFSFVVPKTVHKKAVKRNLLRRRAYSAVQKYLPIIQKKPYVVIAIFRKEAKNASFEAIESDLRSFLQERKILV